MKTFRNNYNNNNKRPRFRSNDRGFKRNGDDHNFSVNSGLKRKAPGRNNFNASKLIEKYTDLAREALSNEDRILSENYFQHADHFTRILKEQENNAVIKTSNVKSDDSIKKVVTDKNKDISNDNEKIDQLAIKN